MSASSGSMRIAVLVAAIVSAGSPSAAQASRVDDAQATAGEILEAFREAAEFPGASLGYVLPDGTAGGVAVGLADIKTGEAMTVEHRLLAGSVGKTFFAALALTLVETGELNLDLRVADILGDESWFPRLPNGSEITVRQLMNHTSGLPRYVTLPAFGEELAEHPFANRDGEELIRFVLDLPAEFEPGSGFSYADTNYIVLALVIEELTDRSCYDLIQERFLNPLDLQGVVAQRSPDIPNLANGYIHPGRNLAGLDADDVLDDGRLRFNPQFEWAGGGFATTGIDLARWAHALYSGEVLSAETKATMVQGVPANMLEPNEAYGLGVIIRSTELGPAHGHSGYFPGYLTEVFHYPELGVTVSILVNTTQMSAALNPRTIRRTADACARAIVDRDDRP